MVTRIKYCPRCHSSNLILFGGGMLGTYRCLNCGYIGPLVIEKEFIKTMDEGKEKKNLKKIQKK